MAGINKWLLLPSSTYTGWAASRCAAGQMRTATKNTFVENRSQNQQRCETKERDEKVLSVLAVTSFVLDDHRLGAVRKSLITASQPIKRNTCLQLHGDSNGDGAADETKKDALRPKEKNKEKEKTFCIVRSSWASWA